jgi:hypothetical protein
MPATKKSTAIEIWDLDGNGVRCALAIRGVIRYVGSRDDCERRALILAPSSDRDRQDVMLARALR